ncbi:MAG: hypothetical protein ACXWQR_07160 [Ktedonobacterales bacterium]
MRGIPSMRFARLAPWFLSATLLLFTGCSSSASTSILPSGTVTATASSHSSPTNTPVSAPPHAFAWFQIDSAHMPQIWASVNGGTPRQITHVAPASGDCINQIAWSPPVFSPDLRHVVAAMGGYNCGDVPLSGQEAVIDIATGAIALVPGTSSYVRISQRTSGWLDNNTIFFVNGTGIFTFTLGSGGTTLLPGGHLADEAVLRGTTLFWTSLDLASSNWTTTLHRYDMTTHSALPGVITLGQMHACQCSPGDFPTPGWDASPDGSRVVYQAVTPKTGSDFGITSSRVYAANADGSGASQIARYMTTTELIRMQFSPNGRLVAFTSALPSPSVISASSTSPGDRSDPNFHAYTPDAVSFPVWKWDSSSFWAANKGPGDTRTTGTTALYYYTAGSPGGTIGVLGGYNPWYTIGR